MKKRNLIVMLIFIVGISANLFSQNEAYRGGLFENYGVALKAGTFGLFGFDFSTSLHPNIKARVGFNYLGFNKNSGIGFDGTGLNTGNKISVEVDRAELRFSNANLLVDYFPMQSGIFHLTTGLYFGQSKVQAYGNAPDKFVIGDYVITPDADGSFSVTAKLGGAVKPYFGLGLGRTIPKGHVGFKFELGIVYQGKLKIESENMDTSGLDSEIEGLNIPKIFTPFWPMATFSLSYRIK